MSVLEEHFIGWDPRGSYPMLEACPLVQECYTHVWYLHWQAFGRSRGLSHGLRVSIVWAYACFDIVGNLISPFPIDKPGGAGASCDRATPPLFLPTVDELYAFCIAKIENLPQLREPGTVELAPAAAADIGTAF